MKVGVLTFHISCNYGAQLQAYAMRRVLERMGHAVEFVDCRDGNMSEIIASLTGSRVSVVRRVKDLLRAVLGATDKTCLVRQRAAAHFAIKYLSVSDRPFRSWREVETPFDVDALIVGSDQVWNCVWLDPAAYLLEDAPPVHAIAYAVSLGLKEMPKDQEMRYRAAGRRFSGISVRESEGASILRGLGVTAEHVVDPTLLTEPADWDALVGSEPAEPHFACYFIEPGWERELREIDSFAARTGCAVDVFVGAPRRKAVGSLFQIVENWSERLTASSGRVRIREASGADDFVRSLSTARGVVSDSFHALMFSSIFGRDVRIVRPRCENRMAMFSRISEFAASFVCGDWESASVADAVRSLVRDRPVAFRSDQIARVRHASESWLVARLKEVERA